jgi:hypothetical protein
VRFEVGRFVGPFELCHCTRCRRASGSAFAAMIGVRAEDFRWLSGRDQVRSYEAPILRRPPAYKTAWCATCGSPAPDPPPGAEWFEIAAGTLDDDPRLRPDRHIFVELRAPWYTIADAIPKLDMAALARLRREAPRHP